jgi:hypothetical protein
MKSILPVDAIAIFDAPLNTLIVAAILGFLAPSIGSGSSKRTPRASLVVADLLLCAR